jgi:hypothetical protein
MAKVAPSLMETYYTNIDKKKLNIAELHVDMNRLLPMYFLHRVEIWIMRVTALVAVMIGVVLLIVLIMHSAGKMDKENYESAKSGTLFWGTFFIMILSLCSNFVSDRKDKSIMPYVNDYVEKLFPDESTRLTPENMFSNGHALDTIWNGVTPQEEGYFIDDNIYSTRMSIQAAKTLTKKF